MRHLAHTSVRRARYIEGRFRSSQWIIWIFPTPLALLPPPQKKKYMKRELRYSSEQTCLLHCSPNITGFFRQDIPLINTSAPTHALRVPLDLLLPRRLRLHEHRLRERRVVLLGTGQGPPRSLHEPPQDCFRPCVWNSGTRTQGWRKSIWGLGSLDVFRRIPVVLPHLYAPLILPQWCLKGLRVEKSIETIKFEMKDGKISIQTKFYKNCRRRKNYGHSKLVDVS